MQRLERLIDQGTGREPADIVLKGGRFFDLVTGELVASDIAICEDRIVGTSSDYTGKTEMDISGKIVVPGAGHWVQYEADTAVNALLLAWLAR